MADFTVRHPEWSANIDTWRMAWDFLRGGKYVISPGHKIATLGGLPYMGTIKDDPVGGEAKQARPAYAPTKTNSYLHPHIREPIESHMARSNRASHYPILRNVSNIYTSSVLRTGPNRAGVEREPWQTYLADADTCGTTHDALMRVALFKGLGLGRMIAVTDRPTFEDAAPSMDHAMARGDRAYTYLLPPWDLVDWALDSRGVFRWAVIREDQPDQRSPGEDTGERKDQYRVWYPDKWELYREDVDGQARSFKQAEKGEHPVGRVPVRVLYTCETRDSKHSIHSDSMLLDLLETDRSVFNLLSLLDESIYNQAFSLLAVPLGLGDSLTSIDIGPAMAFGYNAEAGQPRYLSPAADVIRVQWDLIVERLSLARQTHGVSRGRAEFSKEERSAATLAIESQDKNNAVASLAEHLETFDNGIMADLAEWNGDSVNPPPPVAYSRDVSLRALSQQINDALSIKQLGVSPAAMVEITKPLIEQTLKEHGRSQDEIANALGAIGDMQQAVSNATEEPPSMATTSTAT